MTSTPNPSESSSISKSAKSSLASLSYGKLALGSVMLIGLVATVLLVLRGTDFCLFSSCPQQVTSEGSLFTDFWSFAGGTVALLVTIYLGLPLLPAVGIAAGAWFVIYGTLHLGH